MKTWKYGLEGSAGGLFFGIAFVVRAGYFDLTWLAGIIPVIIFGNIGGRW